MAKQTCWHQPQCSNSNGRGYEVGTLGGTINHNGPQVFVDDEKVALAWNKAVAATEKYNDNLDQVLIDLLVLSC
jgi:hypothetical protein